MSRACHACLTSRTSPACPAPGATAARAVRIRRRPENASWRQAAGVRPVMPAISANG